MVNLELYKIFVVVGNELNITKASEKLNISQPAITKHIKNLEETLGVTLFKRNSRGLIFTEKGENLYNKLKEPINEIIEIDKNFNNDISIIVGSHNHLLNVVFGKSINEFCLKYPNINILYHSFYKNSTTLYELFLFFVHKFFNFFYKFKLFTSCNISAICRQYWHYKH